MYGIPSVDVIEANMYEKIEKYANLVSKSHEVEVAWLRHVLTLAAGALALLAGLGPEVPPDGPARILLAATWACLGTGIVAGAAATYIEVDRARSSVNVYGEQISRELDNKPIKVLVQAPTNRLIELCKPAMILSLLGAVVCLTAYAIGITLAT